MAERKQGEGLMAPPAQRGKTEGLWVQVGEAVFRGADSPSGTAGCVSTNPANPGQFGVN